MGLIVLHAVFLVLTCLIQGSRAVTPVFVLKGSDVQLDVKEADVPEDFVFLLWKFNGTDSLASFTPGGKPKVFSNYTGRVELVTKFSVKLKNVQETDSGVYAARVTGNKDQILAEYKVTVQAPVSPVTLTVDPVSNSSDSCNLTVTCRTLGSNISSTFTCVHQTCSKDGDRSENTTSGAVLHVYLENYSIKCNHSNQVSSTINQGATRIQDFCHQRKIKDKTIEDLSGAQTSGAVVGSLAGVLVLCIVCWILCFRKIKKGNKQPEENTVYDVPQENNRDQTQNQNPVTSTYALVQFHKAPEQSTNTVIDAKPETIYAQVKRPDKSQSLESPTPDPKP